MASPDVEAAAERAAKISAKTTTLSLVFQAELTAAEITMLSVTIQDVVREVAKWTIGDVPFQIVRVGEVVATAPDAVTFEAGDGGDSLDFWGAKP